MQGDGTECGWNCKRAAIDFGSRGSGGERLDVASDAADLVEQRQAFLRRRPAGDLRIARGRFAGANEAGEAIDIEKTVGSWLVVRLRDGDAAGGDLVQLQAGGSNRHPHGSGARRNIEGRVLILSTPS